MKDSYHSVRPVFNDGRVKFEFKCPAPPDAPCRSRSATDGLVEQYEWWYANEYD